MSTDAKREVLVLGAGVTGLCSAIRLAEAGYAVVLWTRDLPQATVSGVAAAIWTPFAAEPRERVLGWSQSTHTVLVELVHEARSGVVLRRGCEATEDAGGPPWWSSALGELEPTPAELLPAGAGPGFEYEAPVCEMPLYLAFLHERLEVLGGRLELRTVHHLREALSASRLVVNCTGLGSRELARDHGLFPIRGQVVSVEHDGRERFFLGGTDAEPLYIVPRSRDLVLGGTVEPGRESTTPDPRTTEDILRRCAAAFPELAQAPVLGVKAGLRPGRRAVRLEPEPFPEGLVIHNYGHGGSGVTLSWGCADEVLVLANEHAPRLWPAE